ncbi:MAG: type III toxin-antitoxin system ToxN/AbiQ family toxin [Candidatus Ornithomonoglobus sp.]
MNLYHIKDTYIDFLRIYDTRVAYNKNERRPYIGIVFTIEDIKYYAPLSSPKPKHLQMKNGIDFHKIKSGTYGIINFNNMIPVPDNALIAIHINKEPDLKYRRLLQNQYRYLKSEFNSVQKEAAKLRKISDRAADDLSNYEKSVLLRCCDFRLLESVYTQYTEK